MNPANQYAAHRALNELEAQRASPDWAGDTAILPKLKAPLATDDTVPMLPALLRPQV